MEFSIAQKICVFAAMEFSYILKHLNSIAANPQIWNFPIFYRLPFYGVPKLKKFLIKTKGAWILRHIFWTHCVTRPRPHSPVSFSFKAQFAGASHFNSFKTDNGTLSKHSSHAHLGKWPPAAVGFMTVIANESDLTYSSINQLIKWWQKNLVIILKNLEGSSHDSFWIYSFRQTADWNSYQKSDNLQYNTLGRWD